MHAEGQRFGGLDLAAIGGEPLQRVEVALPRLRVLLRDHAAADIPLRDHDGAPHLEPLAAPRVLTVRLDAVDAEVHAKPPVVDRVDAENGGKRAQRAGREQCRGAASSPVRGRRRRLDDADRLADVLGQRGRERAEDGARRALPLVERRL